MAVKRFYMYNMDMLQSRFGKIDRFGWCDLERIPVDAETQFTSTNFKEECQTCGVHLKLEAPENQEMNGQVKVIWRTLRTILHSIMVHARFLEAYIHFELMHTEDHIFTVLPIKDLINKDGDPNTPFKIATGTKPSVSNLRMLFFPCVLRTATAHVKKKALNMRQQAQKGFCGISFEITQHRKG